MSFNRNPNQNTMPSAPYAASAQIPPGQCPPQNVTATPQPPFGHAQYTTQSYAAQPQPHYVPPQPQYLAVSQPHYQYPAAAQKPPQQYAAQPQPHVPPHIQPHNNYPATNFPPHQYPPQQFPPQNFAPGTFPAYPQMPQFGAPQQLYPPGYNPQFNQNMPTYAHTGYPPMQYPQFQQQQIPAGYQINPQAPSNCSQAISRDIGSKTLHYVYNAPSIKFTLNSNPVIDAKAVKETLDAFGREKNKIMNVLAHRNSIQREQIKVEFRKFTGKCLIERTKLNYMDPLKHVITSILYTGVEQDAYLLNQSSSGLGKNDDIVMNIICTRSSAHLKAINDIFPKMFRNNLKEQIHRGSMGSYRKLLLHLIDNPRPCQPVDINAAAESARKINDKSFVKIRAPESWIEELCNCSEEQLVQILRTFREINGQPFSEFIKSYSTGDYEIAIQTLAHFIDNPHSYYAALLQKFIQKNSIDGVSFVICTRFEIDLGSIITAYQNNYNTNLLADLKIAFDSFHADVVECFEMMMGLK